jgi:alpha-L-rhamnosidase
MGGERWNDAEFIPGWKLTSYNDTSWAVAREITPPNVLHTWPAMPPSRTLAPVPPVNISQISGKWVVDFGQNVCGWVRLRMNGLTPGQQVTLTYADLISPPELLHIADGNGFQTFGQINRFIAGNSPTAEYLTRFNQHSFRYAVIDGMANAPAVADVEALPVMTALEPIGSFESSNGDVPQIVKTVGDWLMRNWSFGG